MHNEITPNDFPEIRWRGHWIWVEPPAPPSRVFGDEGGAADRPEAHSLFRKAFSLKRVPERVPARITADSRYRLFANGQEVFHGPVIVDLPGQPPQSFPAGANEVKVR
jgi:hypothetical protein